MSKLFIELPVIYKRDDPEDEDERETTDLTVLDINIITAFNPASNGKQTTVRVDSPEESWIIDMPYDEFKTKLESVIGKIHSFLEVKINEC